MVALSLHSELYNHDGVSVSPSWLVKGKSRFAIRTIVQLDFIELVPPRGRALFMLVVGFCLILLSLYYVQAGARPILIPIVMLVASVVLASGSALALYLARPTYRIDVILLDRSRIALDCQQQSEAQELLTQLSRAMDWHRNADLEFDVPRGSWLRQGVAHGKGRRRGPAAAIVREGSRRFRDFFTGGSEAGRKQRIHRGAGSARSVSARTASRNQHPERKGLATAERDRAAPPADADSSLPVGPVVATRQAGAASRASQALSLLSTLSRRHE
ncbi:MAG: hypothetical protein HKN42_04575 [Granulosicoccus sp.]|nr:hypothetical protein [Granulosicoccus sp.]